MNNIRILLTSIFLATSFYAFAQGDPFSGSSRIIKKKLDLRDFNKISLLDLDGKTKVVVGDSFKVEIQIREKYLPILLISQNKEKLEFRLNYTSENNKYIEDPKINILITCPELVELNKKGNSSVSVKLKVQNEFYISNEGNGNAELKGIVENLKIKNDGNGSFLGSRTLSKNLTVESYGNGNVVVNSWGSAKGIRHGNGKIIQRGKAILDLD